MEFKKYKPDFNETLRYWDTFWNRQIIDRPCIVIQAPKEGIGQSLKLPCRVGYNPRIDIPYGSGGQLVVHLPLQDGKVRSGQFELAVKTFEKWARGTFFGGEAIPSFHPTFGPDQFAAFLGAELMQSKEKIGTSWAVPFVDNWEKVLPFNLQENNSVWNETLNFLKYLASASEGKFLISMLEVHSNMDGLAAIRGIDKLCIDLIEQPKIIEKAMRSIRSLYFPVYEGIYEAGDMARRGTIGWAPFYSFGKFATIQCDAICMISPDMARRYVIPALEEEASYLDHSVYHLDGPDALVHLQDILAISKIDVIQWVPGAGQPSMVEWIDLLKRIQKAGKGLQINCSTEEVKIFHKELRPEGVLYVVEASSERKAQKTISWLKSHT